MAINLPAGSTLTIQGTNGSGGAAVQTIDGGGTERGLFVYSGDVTVENLTLENMLAQGGNGAPTSAAAAPDLAAGCSWLAAATRTKRSRRW